MCNEATPADALPQNDELASVHIKISVPAVDRPAHRTVDREEWVPDGTPAQDCHQAKKSSLLYYAEHVGRAALLAAAIGVGAAIAGTAGTASAAPAKADTTLSAPSTATAPGGRSAADKTADSHTRTAAGPSNSERKNRSEKTENERHSRRENSKSRRNSRLDADTAAPDATPNAAPTNPAAVAPSETTDSAPARDHTGETAVAPLAVPANPATAASPAVQSTQATTLWSVLGWARHIKTVSATTTPAPAAGGTAAASGGTATVVSSGAATVVAKPAQIKLPASATVFTLRGRGFGALTPDRMPVEYGGIFSQAPYTMQALKYDTWGLGAFDKGVQMLDKALMSTSGNIIVMTHSEGSEIASRWIRLYADDPVRAAMAGRITFLLSGNPVRSGTGYLIDRFEGDGSVGVATPTDSPWAIIDVARRWDGWADWPADPTNRWAAAEAKAGKSASHMWYNKVDLYSSQNTVWRQGNTTFVLTHEDDLEILKRYRDAPADFVSAVRAEVEAGYNRPSADIPVPVQQIQSAQWRATFARLVAKYGDPAGILAR